MTLTCRPCQKLLRRVPFCYLQRAQRWWTACPGKWWAWCYMDAACATALCARSRCEAESTQAIQLSARAAAYWPLTPYHPRPRLTALSLLSPGAVVKEEAEGAEQTLCAGFDDGSLRRFNRRELLVILVVVAYFTSRIGDPPH